MPPSPAAATFGHVGANTYVNDWGDGDDGTFDKKSDERKGGAESVAELARKAERCEPSFFRPPNSRGPTYTSPGPTRQEPKQNIKDNSSGEIIGCDAERPVSRKKALNAIKALKVASLLEESEASLPEYTQILKEKVKKISGLPDGAHKTETNTIPRSRSVNWGSITLIEHARDLGDNPGSSSGGPPITLGWEPVNPIITVDLDRYENSRRDRRKREEMMVPPNQREAWLRAEGYGSRQIYEATRKARAIREQREKSNERMKFDHMDQLLESARRKISHARPRLRKQKKQSYTKY